MRLPASGPTCDVSTDFAYVSMMAWPRQPSMLIVEASIDWAQLIRRERVRRRGAEDAETDDVLWWLQELSGNHPRSSTGNLLCLVEARGHGYCTGRLYAISSF
jgi:hypothetical protein